MKARVTSNDGMEEYPTGMMLVFNFAPDHRWGARRQSSQGCTFLSHVDERSKLPPRVMHGDRGA